MDTSKHRLERILCAVTFSLSARRVVAWAASLAASNDAEARLLQIAVTTASAVKRDHNEVVASGRPCVEIVRVATIHDADLIVMGIDAPPTSPAEFGETTSCVMRFAAKTVLLVPERLCGARGARRGNRPP